MLHREQRSLSSFVPIQLSDATRNSFSMSLLLFKRVTVTPETSVSHATKWQLFTELY